jgi:hypothetical protein
MVKYPLNAAGESKVPNFEGKMLRHEREIAHGCAMLVIENNAAL